ncbi:twitch domain-containing radical SAM protein [Ancylomarina sp. 16SWW S1-10-2]|uniref:twitch domain-containing radical SAM protein n=1 Tax=Ancylomarina sp. 16SWW S1-10-2 TaxID=2499681 RepID=UPI0012AE4194|nr:twitch domain-containing radical SAM protein [Ancylomarina sp. 16SWW S1-10-2]MRT92751.1 twitch domain-containing radical SAM protein [Ancylomarina sp. 16SWW S1-10-2]
MNSKTPFCLMPFIHYHIGNSGYVKACCVANITYGNCNTQSFDDVWNGEAINKLRTKFKKGESDPRCAVCLNIEKAGGKSIRQETFERFSLKNTSEAISLPTYFDIRFSNVCNFACRTCWHGASSAWFPEAKKLKRNCGNEAIIQNITDFEHFISETGEALLQAEEIYFAGGEPLMSEEHYLLLEYLIENKHTKLRLRYNTNFSILEYKGKNILDYWKEFENIEILASIDAHESLGEYIRRGFNWNQFVKNRDAIRNLKHIQFKIAPTISVLSIANLPNLYKTCLELNIIGKEDFYINILERPYYYNTKAIPAEFKLKISKSFDQFYIWAVNNEIPHSVINQFKECIDYMKADDLSKHWNKFIAETALFDELRHESSPFLKDLFELD